MKPLVRAHHALPASPALIAACMKQYPYLTETGARDLLDRDMAKCEYWLNDLYQVEVRREDGSAHLNIRRRDGKAIFRDWRHFQEIKNQLVGPECEAVELYPAESRVVDTSNKYHLWCCTDPTFRFPFGFDKRHIETANDGNGTAGMKQR